ncbi:MAG: nicotinamide mononucleotide transporter [Clostridia bacterium]|nr:nicotinamide mononucleotide transporter [Clostridia bacterium]
MIYKNPFKNLSKFEWGLWSFSIIFTVISYIIGNSGGVLSLIASLIGATALIFVSKGDVFGQFLIVIFALLYGYISLSFKYYGEMFTYLFMSAPMAIFSIITWIRNPYKKGKNEVKIRKHLGTGQVFIMSALTVLVTVIFYFILKYFNTANLILSTVSILTSFLACWLTMLRSPLYALAYAANDIVLIALWIYASFSDIGYLPMVICFVVFLANDLYGYYNWKRISKRQAG